MDWQTATALTIVAIAVAVFLKLSIQSLVATANSGCGTSCNGCPSSTSSTHSAADSGRLELVELGRD